METREHKIVVGYDGSEDAEQTAAQERLIVEAVPLPTRTVLRDASEHSRCPVAIVR